MDQGEAEQQRNGLFLRSGPLWLHFSDSPMFDVLKATAEDTGDAEEFKNNPSI